MSKPILDPDVKRLKRVFGVVYFVQGMKSLPDLSMFFYLMQVLKVSPFVGQLFQGLSQIAWFIKPLWGWISDRFVLFGYRRKSYFILMALIALGSWFLTGLCAFIGLTSFIPYLILINLANLAYAFVDAVADAVMVEEGQRLKQVGLFVNFQWLSIGFSIFIVTLFSGWFQTKISEGHFSYWMIFSATGIFPLLTAVIGFSNLKEVRVVPLRRESKPLLLTNVFINFIKVPLHIGRGLSRAFQFLRHERLIVVLILFLFMWHFSPSIGYLGRMYKVEKLQFTPMIMGVLGAIDSVVWIISIFIYRWFVKRFKTIRWDQYLYFMIFLGTIALILGYYYYLPPEHPLSVTIPFPWEKLIHRIASWKEFWWGHWFYQLVEGASHWNRYHWWTLFTNALLGFATMPAWLIPLTLAGEAANKAHAGFIYALLMSVSNLTNSLADVAGAFLYKLFTASWMKGFLDSFQHSVFNISRSADQTLLILQIFVYISALFTFLAIPFVYLVKKEFDQRGIEVHLA